MLKIVVNGESREFKEQISLEEVIRELNIHDKVMAAAVNMQIVKKDNWAEYILKDNDKLELLNFVGGG